MKNNLPKNFFEELDWSALMKNLDEIISSRQLTTDICQLTDNNLQLTTNHSGKLLTEKEVESILEIASGLISPQFREWHIGRIYKLGPTEYLSRYDKAMKFGTDKPKYFSAILKKAV